MHLQFYTQESLGQTRSLTPEGFLLCEHVPLARTGTLLYAEGEVPVEAGPNGIISITRDEDEVFHPNAIASFNGKPVTNDHPLEHVSPDNWRAHAIGHVMNPRRGDGREFDRDYLYADLLVTDRDAIQAVIQGKREVSAGYDATYEQIAPGFGKQLNIIGNHVALVDRGRCGPRCAIGDRAMPQAKTKLTAFRDRMNRILQAHRTGDEAGVTREVEGMIGHMISGTNDELNPMPTNEWESPPTEQEHKGVTVHVHAAPHPSNAPMSTAGAPAAPAGTDAGAAPGAGADPTPAPGGAAAGGDPMQQIMQRLQTLEQALAALMQDGGDEDGPPKDDDDDKPTGDSAVEGPTGVPEGNPADQPFDAENPENVTEGGTGKGEPTNTGEDPGKAPANRPTGDSARVVTADSRALANSFLDMNKLAAILLPDVRVPTFDAARTRAQTIDAMCKFRKNTLLEAYKNDEVRGFIDAARANHYGLLEGPLDVKSMTCDAASAIFANAAAAVRDANNARMSNPRPTVTRSFGSKVPTPAEINAMNRQRFGIQR